VYGQVHYSLTDCSGVSRIAADGRGQHVHNMYATQASLLPL